MACMRADIGPLQSAAKKKLLQIRETFGQITRRGRETRAERAVFFALKGPL